MRETQFISQNKENWREFEEELRKKEKDPDKLSRLFTEITDDLSYSRSFYSNRSVRYYLNSLAQRLYLNVYKNKKKTQHAFLNFWIEELPAIIYHSRWDFLISLVLFLGSVAIGVFCCMEDPDFCRKILGDQYVEMTLENIRNGDPLAVYKGEEELSMSLRITFNNLVVAFRTFALGILLGIGTIASMLANGIMVGAFHYLLIDQGIVKESFLTIWQHGTLELSAIVIAGAAGIVIGRGWFFPGSYSRIQAFKYAAIRGMKIFIGIAPIIIMAGFIEGFITRHTEFPDAVRILVIILSFGIILGYYVVLPFRISKAKREKYAFEGTNDMVDNFSFESEKILNNGEIFTSTFQIYKKTISKSLVAISIISLLYGILVFVVGPYTGLKYEELSTQFDLSSGMSFLPSMLIGGIANIFYSLTGFFDYQLRPILFVFNLLTFVAFTFIGYKRLLHYLKENNIIHPDLIPSNRFMLLNTAGLIAIAGGTLFAGSGWIILIMMVLSPILLLSISVMFMEKQHFFTAFISSLKLIKQMASNYISMTISLLLFGLFAFLLISSPLSYVVMEFFNWNLAFDADIKDRLFKAAIIISSVFGLGLTYLFFMTGYMVMYFTLKEVNNANGLIRKIERLGNTTKLNGLAREHE